MDVKSQQRLGLASLILSRFNSEPITEKHVRNALDTAELLIQLNKEYDKSKDNLSKDKIS